MIRNVLQRSDFFSSNFLLKTFFYAFGKIADVLRSASVSRGHIWIICTSAWSCLVPCLYTPGFLDLIEKSCLLFSRRSQPLYLGFGSFVRSFWYFTDWLSVLFLLWLPAVHRLRSCPTFQIFPDKILYGCLTAPFVTAKKKKMKKLQLHFIMINSNETQVE